MTTATATPSELPLLDGAMALSRRSHGKPLKRFVVFDYEGHFLIARKGFRSLNGARRRARRNERWAIAELSFVVDQASYSNPVYRDDVMYLEDYQELA